MRCGNEVHEVLSKVMVKDIIEGNGLIYRGAALVTEMLGVKTGKNEKN